jgi:hypothetical protein
MTTDELLQHLKELELALHQPAVQRDPARMDELLHESFAEFGRSGRSYNRGDILEMLQHEVAAEPLWAQEFSVAEIADGIASLTYRSADVNETGELCHHALRASLWQRTPRGWQLRFH